MSSLFTAFKGKLNTSFQLVSQMDTNKLFLTNSFSGLEKDISSFTEKYDAVYMFGVDKGLDREVRIERCAQCDLDTAYTEFDIQALSSQMTAQQIKHHISGTPTYYLCNAAYYHMLCKNKNAVFIHVPSTKGMDIAFMTQLATFFRGIMY